MVAAGLSRALDGPVIIETAQPGWFEDVFVPQASDVIATQLSDTFTYLITLVLARAGVDVTLPTGLFTPTTTTDESTRDPSGTRDPRGKILRAAQ